MIPETAAIVQFRVDGAIEHDQFRIIEVPAQPFSGHQCVHPDLPSGDYLAHFSYWYRNSNDAPSKPTLTIISLTHCVVRYVVIGIKNSTLSACSGHSLVGKPVG